MNPCALRFEDLLELVGARPGRGRRWFCGKCEGKTPALAVDMEREVFFCHRCQWRGGRRNLERAAGIKSEAPTPDELNHRQQVRAQAEGARRAWRGHWEFYRDLNWLLLDIERDARSEGRECFDRGEPMPEWIFSNLDFAMRAQERIWPELCFLSGTESGAGQEQVWADEIYRRYRESPRKPQK